MHDTAAKAGDSFARIYGFKGAKVVDVGGMDVNGSLRAFFENQGMDYKSVDLETHPSVDYVIKPGDPLPFPDESIDIVVSTDCFEHDPCFWITFREMARIVKKGGWIYVNAPANGPYHRHPGDNWRFYADAAQALAVWSGRTWEGKQYPVSVEESFYCLPLNPNQPNGYFRWIDWVSVWQKKGIVETEIVNDTIKQVVNRLERFLNQNGCKTQKIVHLL